MSETLKSLQKQLNQYEKVLDRAYINYAKRVDQVATEEMIKINECVDQIIIIKQMIKEEEGLKKDE